MDTPLADAMVVRVRTKTELTEIRDMTENENDSHSRRDATVIKLYIIAALC
jgi:hypothetical protein